MCLLIFLCFLVAGLKTVDITAAFGAVFGFAPSDPLAPAFEGLGVLDLSHQLDGLVFTETKLVGNGVKRGAVFPCHHDEPVEVFGGIVGGVGFHAFRLAS